MVNAGSRRSLWLGIVFLAVGAPLYHYSARTVRALVDGLSGPVLTPPLSSPAVSILAANTDDFVPRLVDQLLYFAFAVGTYVGLTGLLLGSGLLVVGVATSNLTSLRDLLAVASDARRKYVLGGLTALLIASAFSAAVRSVTVELVVIATVGGPIFALAGATAILLQRRAGRVRTVLLVGPFATAAVLLSVVCVAFVSPTFGEAARAATVGLARAAVDGLPASVVGRPVSLSGPGAAFVWIVVDLVVGWLVGLGVWHYDVDIWRVFAPPRWRTGRDAGRRDTL